MNNKSADQTSCGWSATLLFTCNKVRFSPTKSIYGVSNPLAHRSGIMSKLDWEDSGQCRSNNFVSDSIYVTISPIPTIHKNIVFFLNSWGTLVVYIPYNTNPDQTVPIWVHTVCIHDGRSLKGIGIYAAGIRSRQHFQDKNIGRIREKTCLCF